MDYGVYIGLDDILATTGPPMPNFFKVKSYLLHEV